MRRAWLRVTGAATIPLLGGCSGIQSAFVPNGPEADQIHALFWVMTIGGGAIFAGVLALTAAAVFGPASLRQRLTRNGFIIGGGVVLPVVTLTGVLAYGLSVMAIRSSPGDETGQLRVAIVGEQWWWRVRYALPDGSQFESANELHIPIGTAVPVELGTADVIHSFWVPNLAGKLDMIPGRTNVLTLTATEPAISRGQCAEYCGGAHALMSFYVVASTPEAFAAWSRHEAGPAIAPETDVQRRGAELFLNLGCGGCHTVRGTPAAGVIGPDLTHVGGRRSLAAAALPNNAAAFADWIRNNQHIKPENRMPPYEILSEAELASLAAYLEHLR
jgi:cytochrome c oxidase subunit II